MRYRPAELSDHDTVVDTWRALAEEQRDHGSRIDPERSRPAIGAHLASLIVDGNVVVAEADGDVVGVVVYSRRDGPLVRTEAVGVVEYLYVEPDRRGEGIGSTLLERAEDALAEMGVTAVDVGALADNDAAIAFYERAGYRGHRRRFTKSLAEDPQKR